MKEVKGGPHSDANWILSRQLYHIMQFTDRIYSECFYIYCENINNFWVGLGPKKVGDPLLICVCVCVTEKERNWA